VVPQEPEDHRGAALLYLHGLSGKDFIPALEEFLCTGGCPPR
jgi:hypothetical protein